MARAAAKEVEPVWLTVAETQKYLGMGTRNIQQQWRDSGQLPYYAVGRKILYKKSEVDRFIEKHRVTPY